MLYLPGGKTSGTHADFRQAAGAGFLDIVEFGQRVFDIFALLAQLFALLVDALHQEFQLADLARRFALQTWMISRISAMVKPMRRPRRISWIRRRSAGRNRRVRPCVPVG